MITIYMFKAYFARLLRGEPDWSEKEKTNNEVMMIDRTCIWAYLHLGVWAKVTCPTKAIDIRPVW